MDVNQYAKASRLPHRTLRWMVRQGYIHEPLTHEDIIGLGLLEKLWWKSEVLRAQLMKFSRKDRQALVETADLPTRWERYACSRFNNLAPGEKLPMKKLIREIEMSYDFTLNHFQVKRLYRVRQRVYNQRKKAKTSVHGKNKEKETEFL